MTEAEEKLWYFLRNHRFLNIKFKRQKRIGFYIVDFAAPQQKLIIEVDGGQHADHQAYDEERTRYLESLGYQVLRFWNHEVLNQTLDVLDMIEKTLSRPKGAPSPASVRGDSS